MVGGSIIAAVGWLSVAALKQRPVELTDEIALYIHSGIFTLLGVLGMFGFVGSLVKSRSMVFAFSVGLTVHLGLSIGSGVFTIYSVFKESSGAAVQACMDENTKLASNGGGLGVEEASRICRTGMSIVKGVIVAIYIIAWLIELYAYFIVARYADQLEDEEIANITPIMPQETVNQHIVYNGYPQRFSYSDYTQASRRSYMPQPPHPEYNYDERERPATAGGARPRSDTQYAFSLPQQAYGVQRGKDYMNPA